jgi:hypothetical protein
MVFSDRLRAAWKCTECRRTRRLAILFVALCVCSWLIL